MKSHCLSVVVLSAIACLTACSSDDTSGPSADAPCSEGSKRCDGRNVEVCAADGAWIYRDACPFACDAGTCTGTCVPGSKVCCATRVIDGQVEQFCNAHYYESDTCISGTGTCTGPGIGVSALIVQGCDERGQPTTIDDCAMHSGTYPDGTVILGCGECDELQTQTCFKLDGTHDCVPN